MLNDEVVFGGKLSRNNKWYPYHSEAESEMVLTVVERADILTPQSWPLWSGMNGGKMQASDDDCIIVASRPVAGRRPLTDVDGNATSRAMPTPPSSDDKEPAVATAVAPEAETGLVEFYRSLDRIERTSPMGARYLEAYAERLHRETCKACWIETNTSASDGAESEGDER